MSRNWISFIYCWQITAWQYSKEYANVIQVNYPGDLRKAVIDLDSADDEGNDARLKRHNRFFRSLREDSLLMVDNFNVTDSQDQFVDVMLKFRCRILFTTCSRYEKHILLEAGDLNPDTLLELGVSCSRKRRRRR